MTVPNTAPAVRLPDESLPLMVATTDYLPVEHRAQYVRTMEGGFRLALFLFAGLLLDTKLQLAYVLGLIPMALGLAIGNRVHLDMTSIGMLRVVGALLVVSGSMLFLKVAI